jgi:hypothetical protein
MLLIAVKKKSDTISTLPLRAISVLLSVGEAAMVESRTRSLNRNHDQEFVKAARSIEKMTVTVNAIIVVSDEGIFLSFRVV